MRPSRSRSWMMRSSVRAPEPAGTGCAPLRRIFAAGPDAAVVAAAAEAACIALRTSKRWTSWILSPATAAIAMYAKKTDTAPEIIRQSIADFQPKATMQSDELKDLDGIMRDAVKLKFLEKPLTPEQLKVFVQIPPK